MNKKKIFVGELFECTVELPIEDGNNYTIQWPDTIPHLEIVEKKPSKSVMKGNAKWYLQTIVYTSYDTGHWNLPSITVISRKKSISSKPLSIGVFYSQESLSSNYRDIKDIVAVPDSSVTWYYWVTAIGLLLIGLLVFLKVRKRNTSQTIVAPELQLTPFEIATQEMKDLKEQLKHPHLDMSIFYIRLTDVFRRFIRDKKRFSSLEKTNGELINYLHNCGLPKEQMRQLEKQLELADAVKFARYKPDHEEAEKSFFLLELAIKFLNQ